MSLQARTAGANNRHISRMPRWTCHRSDCGLCLWGHDASRGSANFTRRLWLSRPCSLAEPDGTIRWGHCLLRGPLRFIAERSHSLRASRLRRLADVPSRRAATSGLL